MRQAVSCWLQLSAWGIPLQPLHASLDVNM